MALVVVTTIGINRYRSREREGFAAVEAFVESKSRCKVHRLIDVGRFGEELLAVTVTVTSVVVVVNVESLLR